VPIPTENRIGYVIVSMLASSVVDRESTSGKTKMFIQLAFVASSVSTQH
jgi:hypothetical protein